MDMIQNNIFEMFNIEVKENLEVEKVNKDKVNSSSQKISNRNVKDKITQTSSKTHTEELEDKLKNFIKIEVKAFGGQIMILEGDEIENINLKTIQNKLVSMGYGEFAEDVIWQVVPNENKTEAILVAGCKFYVKG